MGVSRHNLNGSANTSSTHQINQTLPGNRRRAMQDTEKPSLGGSHATCVQVQPALEFETPYYTYGQRFEAARRIKRYPAFLPHAHDIHVDVPGETPGADYRLDRYVSVAEDFQLGLFIGAPIMYSYPNPVAA